MELHPIKSPRKLIEVALPLEAINTAAAREKSIRQGNPSTLHLWWARRPLAAARAIIFAQLVNDPGFQQGGGFKYGVEKKKAAAERNRLFQLISELVKWENIKNETVLEKARAEIRRSWREVCELNKDHPNAKDLFDPSKLPSLYDPFAGGGAIPLEAQRLGLNAYASDLNPVAVVITKSMIEIAPRFFNLPPVNPVARQQIGGSSGSWKGADGLANDLRYYGIWVRDEAMKLIGHLYRPIKITSEMAKEQPDLKRLVGQSLTIIAWVWARTVSSPNPAFSDVHVPLVTNFVLSGKNDNKAYIQPVVSGGKYVFKVKMGQPPPSASSGTTAGKRKAFRCLLSGSPIDYNFIRQEGQANRMGQRLMAVIVEGPKGRVYLSPTPEMEETATKAKPAWKPDLRLPDNPRDFKTPNYGLMTYGDLFTPRQLTALTTFSDLIKDARARVLEHSIAAGLDPADLDLESESTGALAYSEAVGVFLSLGIGRSANYWSSLTPWGGDFIVQTFGRNALPMVWDFAEANPFSDSTGNWLAALEWIQRVLEKAISANAEGHANQQDAQTQTIGLNKIISTDPPYYDNIGYAELSDYFYVWLRRSLRDIFPALFATIAVPKAEELVATPYRHGGKDKAEAFFIKGMTAAMQRLVEQAHPAIPVTIYYAFKQSEADSENAVSSTGWAAFLEAVIRAGFGVRGTWPMRTERERGLKSGTNSLASSIILVCQKRAADAPVTSRREYIRELNGVLPEALDEMTMGAGPGSSPLAPVDLSQAIIGPGMAVFSKYDAVLEADGSRMSVRTALQLINRFLAEDDFDHDTQFCLHWFEQNGWKEGAFGEADVLSRAKGTSVEGVKQAGVIESGGGKVRLLKWTEYPDDWDPIADTRLPVWEALHHFIRAHHEGGDAAAGKLLAATKQKAEAARQLAYRLYTLCERSSWAEDARAYNEIITSWPAIESAAGAVTGDRDLFGDSV